MYDSVLFDVDGVLLRRHDDHPTVYADAVAETFRSFDVSVSSADLESFYGSATLDEMRRVCERHGIDFEAFWPERERNVSALQQRLMRRGERVLYDDCAVLPEVAAGHDLAAVSNNQHETVEYLIEHFDLGEHFEAAYGREPTLAGFERTKPDTHYVERALSDLDADSGLYVGDSGVDVVAAHRAGLDSAFVRRDHREGYEPPEEPTYEIDRLTELTDVLGDE